PPSARYWFGTDQVGRAILSRVLVAPRLDLAISLSAVTLSFVVGSVLGASAGFFGGWTDRIVTRVTDTIMAFPLFVLAMAIVAALGNTLANIVYATAIINLPFYARMARAEVNVRREAGFVEAARLSGNGSARILTVHVFPNCLPPMMVQASLNLGWAILNAAGLSFIGLGVRPPTPEWGIMVAEGAAFTVVGLLPPAGRVTSGRAVFGGLDLLTASAGQLLEYRGRELSMIFQSPRTALNPIRPVGKQIADVLERHANLPRARRRDRVLELLARVQIPDPERRYHAYPFELSGGMCQRVMIALAVACSPALLIADEPTTGLDVTTQAGILDLLGDLSRTAGM